jgi:very-short-patch-repair endonuclease
MDELDKLMYYGASPSIFEKASLLRKNMTPTEQLLWERIKGKKICGVRFRRQHPIDIFIVDFYCHAALLVIELDGKIHLQQKEYDEGRTAEIEKFDIEVIRFTNQEVETDIESVIKLISEKVEYRLKNKS